MPFLPSVDQAVIMNTHNLQTLTSLNGTNSWVLKGKESRLSIDLVFQLHQAIDPAADVDIDEIECLLANLIFKGNIRGYIAHEKRILVLSKDNPFPYPQQK